MKRFVVILLDQRGHGGSGQKPIILAHHMLGVVESEDLTELASRLGAAGGFQTATLGTDPDTRPHWTMEYFPFSRTVGRFDVRRAEELIAHLIGGDCQDHIQTFRDLVNRGEPVGHTKRYLCLFGEVPYFS